MKIRHLLFGIILTAFVPLLPAQDAWDLKRCLEYAEETNLTLRQFRLNQASSDINLKESQAARLPNLNGFAGGGLRFGRSINPFTNDFEDRKITSFNMGANGNIPLFSGFQINNSIKQSKYDLQTAGHDLEDARNTLGLDIATAYLNILLNMEILGQREVQVASTKEQRDRTEKLVNAGTLARTSLLELEAQLATDETNLVNAQNQLQMSHLVLQQLMNLEPNANFSIAKPELPDVGSNVIIESVEETFSYAEGTQPSILGADVAIQSAQTGIDLAKGAALPTFSFGYSLSTGYSRVDNNLIEQLDFNEQLNNNLGYSFNLNLNIPFYNRRRVRSSVQRAEIRLKQAELEATNRRQLLRQTIEQSYLDVENAFSQYQQVEKQIESLELAFDNATKQFNVGMINSTDYLLAQNNLQRATLDQIRLKYQYHFRNKILDFYLGKPLEF